METFTTIHRTVKKMEVEGNYYMDLSFVADEKAGARLSDWAFLDEKGTPISIQDKPEMFLQFARELVYSVDRHLQRYSQYLWVLKYDCFNQEDSSGFNS